jgi:Flp pilus assembly protein TadD
MPTTTTTEPSGSVATALAHAQRLLAADPRLAVEQAMAILEAVPRHAEATLILATGLRLSGDVAQALRVADPLARAFAQSPPIQLEHGRILAAAGQTQAASPRSSAPWPPSPTWPTPGAVWPRPSN